MRKCPTLFEHGGPLIKCWPALLLICCAQIHSTHWFSKAATPNLFLNCFQKLKYYFKNTLEGFMIINQLNNKRHIVACAGLHLLKNINEVRNWQKCKVWQVKHSWFEGISMGRIEMLNCCRLYHSSLLVYVFIAQLVVMESPWICRIFELQQALMHHSANSDSELISVNYMRTVVSAVC